MCEYVALFSLTYGWSQFACGNGSCRSTCDTCVRAVMDRVGAHATYVCVLLARHYGCVVMCKPCSCSDGAPAAGHAGHVVYGWLAGDTFGHGRHAWRSARNARNAGIVCASCDTRTSCSTGDGCPALLLCGRASSLILCALQSFGFVIKGSVCYALAHVDRVFKLMFA